MSTPCVPTLHPLPVVAHCDGGEHSRSLALSTPAPSAPRPIAASLTSATDGALGPCPSPLGRLGVPATSERLPNIPSATSARQALDQPAGALVRLAMRLAVGLAPAAGPQKMAEALAREWSLPAKDVVALFEAMAQNDVAAVDAAWDGLRARPEWNKSRQREALFFAPIFAGEAAALHLTDRFCEGASAEALLETIDRLMQLSTDWRQGPAPEQAMACDAIFERLAEALGRRRLSTDLRKRAVARFAQSVALGETAAARALFDALGLAFCVRLSDEIMPDGQLRRLTLGGFEVAASIGHAAALARLSPTHSTRWPAMAIALRHGHEHSALLVCEQASADPNEDPLAWRQGIGRLMRHLDPDYPDTPAMRTAIARLTLRIDAWANKAANETNEGRE